MKFKEELGKEIESLEGLEMTLQTKEREKLNEIDLYEEDDNTYEENELEEIQSSLKEVRSMLETLYDKYDNISIEDVDYISIWDIDHEVVTEGKIDTNTGEVYSVNQVEHNPANMSIHNGDYVVWNEKRYEVLEDVNGMDYSIDLTEYK